MTLKLPETGLGFTLATSCQKKKYIIHCIYINTSNIGSFLVLQMLRSPSDIKQKIHTTAAPKNTPNTCMLAQ